MPVPQLDNYAVHRLPVSSAISLEGDEISHPDFRQRLIRVTDLFKVENEFGGHWSSPQGIEMTRN
ncbi:hypothetical protein BOC59_19540 [Burkholderia pseudomallei]|nr:hypothetical protein BOC59_19540 [Burkholderia pseudomallei]